MKKPILLDFLKATTLWGGKQIIDQRETLHVFVGLCAFVPSHLLWVVLEVLRFSQLIVLGGSILSCQHQFLGGNNNLE